VAQTVDVTCLAASWTQLDSLASHTLIEVQNKGAEPIGVIISAATPGALAWNGANVRIVYPGDAGPMWRLATSDHVWGRTQSADQSAPNTTNVYEAV
jgi:hypothetical protein